MGIDNDLRSKDFYIFGAGLVGKLAAKYIKSEYGASPMAYIVSELNCNEYEIDGVQIKSLDLISNKEILIIVALLQWSQPEVIKRLNDLGFRNVEGISETQFQKMRMKIVSQKDELASQRFRIAELTRNENLEQKNTLVISDYGMPDVFRWNQFNIVKSIDFLSDTYQKVDAIIIFLIDWNNGIEKIIDKACELSEKIMISVRSRYAESTTFELVKFIKNKGYQVSSYKKFLRPRYEYDTEDLLITVEIRSEYSLKNDQLCTGCGECEKECVQHAISMRKDKYGYERPIVDEKLCIHCKKCVNSCPVYAYKGYLRNNDTPTCLAFMADDVTREKSSSGGAFSVLAEYALDNGVSVCGAAWMDDYSVKHIFVDDEKDLYRLRRSKYIHSDIKDVYSEIEKKCRQEKKCMFFGCPCQVAAIRNYLGDLSRNVMFIDLICTQAPSFKIFKKYLDENYVIADLKEIGFREKSEGWRPDSFYYISNDGVENIKHWDDSYQRAYHCKLMMPVHCENCSFAGINRVGDITIGDFWGIEQHDKTMSDGKGTSAILINSERGRALLDVLMSKARNIKEEPIEWVIRHNRIGNNIKPHDGRDRFYEEILKNHSFNDTVSSILDGRFDVGLVGNWSFPNYGTELTYYALYTAIKDMGYSVSLIEWPEDSPWKPYGSTQLFRVEPYRNYEMNEKAVNEFDMQKYNDIADGFVHGSDQLLSPLHYFTLQKSAIMSWVNPGKRKVGFAYSFGKDSVNYEKKDEKNIGIYLRNFDAISVREESARIIMHDKFQVKVDRVLDPVFLCEKELYEVISTNRRRDRETSKQYLFAYILDFNEEKAMKIKKLADELNMDVVIIDDAENESNSVNVQGCSILTDISLNDWLSYIRNSSCIVTDSFHGTCMSIIFRKQFMSVVNRYRGATRFDSIAEVFGIENRIVHSFNDISKSRMVETIDYPKVEKIMKNERKKSIKWLSNSLREKTKVSLTDMEMILFDRCARLERELKTRDY